MHQTRWSSWAGFQPGLNVVEVSQARGAKAAQVSYSMLTDDSRRSDQSAVWDEIAVKAERLHAPSPTLAMNAMYDSKAFPMDAYLRAFAVS